MLELKKVSKYYYNKGVIASGFRKLDLKLNIGEFVAIVGESGSGKSTLVNVLSGLDSYEEGEMYVNGEKTSHYTTKDFEEYRKKYISNIYQEFNLINSYTVYQNVELVAKLNGYSRKESKEKIVDIIEKVGLTKYKNTKVSKLSGGQKQRVAIARALIKNSPIIIADEPTGNIDTKSAKEVITLLKELSKDKLVIVVTHNYEQVQDVVTRKIKMHDGRIIEDTVFEEKAPQVIKPNKNKDINIFNKLILGFRNTFNIVPKFLLLLAIFLFISLAVTSIYTLYLKNEDDIDGQYSNASFGDQSDNRIIVIDKDGKKITDETLEKISKINGVDKIIKQDKTLEAKIGTRGEMFVFGNIYPVENITSVDIGRLPKEDNEVVLVYAKLNTFIKGEQMLNKEHTFIIQGNKTFKLKVVGIKFTDNENVPAKIGVSKAKAEEIVREYKIAFSEHSCLYQDYLQKIKIEPSDKVAKGYAYVPEQYNYMSPKEKAVGQKIELISKYMKEETKINLEIKEVYKKDNIKKLLDLDKYPVDITHIYINPEDYNTLITNDTYQSSVYVKSPEMCLSVEQELDKLNLKSLAVKDTKSIPSADFVAINRVTNLVISIVIVVVVFFISYVLIKIVFKSRNVYFATIRMLGASKKVVRQLLLIELVIVQTIGFGAVCGLVYLIKEEYIKNKFLLKLSTYLNIQTGAVLYILLTLLTVLIAIRYSKELYKKTAIGTYGEEV